MDVFGGSSGGIDTLSGSGLSNEFNSIATNDIDTIINSNRIKPNQIQSGLTRGTFRVNNIDGSYAILGVIPGSKGEFGLAFFDANNNLQSQQAAGSLAFYDEDGNIQSKYTGPTDYKYRSDKTNYWQAGTLPDGTRNIAIAKDDYEVTDAF